MSRPSILENLARRDLAQTIIKKYHNCATKYPKLYRYTNLNPEDLKKIPYKLRNKVEFEILENLPDADAETYQVVVIVQKSSKNYNPEVAVCYEEEIGLYPMNDPYLVKFYKKQLRYEFSQGLITDVERIQLYNKYCLEECEKELARVYAKFTLFYDPLELKTSSDGKRVWVQHVSTLKLVELVSIYADLQLEINIFKTFTSHELPDDIFQRFMHLSRHGENMFKRITQKAEGSWFTEDQVKIMPTLVFRPRRWMAKDFKPFIVHTKIRYFKC